MRWRLYPRPMRVGSSGSLRTASIMTKRRESGRLAFIGSGPRSATPRSLRANGVVGRQGGAHRVPRAPRGGTRQPERMNRQAGPCERLWLVLYFRDTPSEFGGPLGLFSLTRRDPAILR